MTNALPPVPPGIVLRHPASNSPLSVAVSRLTSLFKPVPALPVSKPAVISKSLGPSVTLAWNASDGASWYNLYWGPASRAYTNQIQAFDTQAEVSPLVPLSTNFFAVTQVNTNDVVPESDFSSEISYVVPAGLVAPTNWLVSVAVLQSTDQILWPVLTNLPVLNFSNVNMLPQVYWRALMGVTNQ